MNMFINTVHDEKDCKRIKRHNVDAILRTLAKHDGFLSGGGARIFALDVINNDDNVNIHNYLFHSGGDLDLFFTDEYRSHMMLREIEKLFGDRVFVVETTPSGVATELHIDCSDGKNAIARYHELLKGAKRSDLNGLQRAILDRQVGNVYDVLKIQIVHKITGDIENVLQSFDITNCMYAIKPSVDHDGNMSFQLTKHSMIDELEKTRTLHVQKFGLYTINRLVKWRSKHQFNNFHNENFPDLKTQIIDYANKVREKTTGYNLSKVIDVLNNLVAQNSSEINCDLEKLLELSAIWPSDLQRYDYAFKTFLDKALLTTA